MKIVKFKHKKGQSTTEFLVLAAAIITIVLVFLAPGGVFRTALEDTVDTTSQTMTLMSNRIFNSQQ